MSRSPRTLYLPVRYAHLVVHCPNFAASGSITGMRKQFYGHEAQLIRCGCYVYNVSGATAAELANIKSLAH